MSGAAPKPETSHGFGHEPDQSRVGVLVWMAVGLLVAVALAVGAAWLVFQVLSAGAPSGDQTVREFDAGTAAHWNDPPGDLARVRATEEARLQSLEWIDRVEGIARIPIGDAMRLVAEGKRVNGVAKAGANDSEGTSSQAQEKTEDGETERANGNDGNESQPEPEGS